MIDTILFVAIINLIILLYIYAGYPVLLYFLSKIAPKKVVQKKTIRPSVSIVISCYNEEKVIRKKLENTLHLDYPKTKLEVIVVSDGSTDGTDEIVRDYSDRGIRLLRQEGRLGKTYGINTAIAEAQGEIVVFSDANAMYQTDAIIRLVENFADESVGYVVGEARYTIQENTPASHSENTYWNYEIIIKKLESRIHSIVGGDGAIYAIRKTLYEPLKQSDINDFVNPLQIIAKGFRGIYEPSAICTEEAAGEFDKEFKRKSRIVNRSFSGLLRVKTVLNPFRTGLFSIQILSHKVLRWFAGIFMAIFFVCSLVLAFSNNYYFQIIVLIEIIMMGCAYIGYLYRSKKTSSLFHHFYYFAGVNIAALHGLYDSLRGSVQVTWEPHRSADSEKRLNSAGRWLVHASAVGLAVCFLVVAQDVLKIELFLWKLGLWSAMGFLLYTFLGYPLLLWIWSCFAPDRVRKQTITPSVTMLVCAYNEEEVIEQKIRNSLEIEYPADKLKIVIASDGSSDLTVDIAKKFKDDRLIIKDYPQRSGKIGVINKTVPDLSGDILLFSDANTMLEKGTLRKLMRNFSDPRIGAVSGNVILENEFTTFSKGEHLYYKYERFIQKKESILESIIGADGGMYALRRHLFVPPLENTINDDFVISMNVALNGHRVIYEPEARGYESNLISYREEFKRKSRVVAGAIQSLKSGQGTPTLKQKKLLFCFMSHKLFRWAIPYVLIFALFTNLRLVYSNQAVGYLVLLTVQLLLYMTACTGFLIKRRISRTMLIIPFYFCLEHAAALYGIYKGLFNKQSVKWTKFKRKNLMN